MLRYKNQSIKYNKIINKIKLNNYLYEVKKKEVENK